MQQLLIQYPWLVLLAAVLVGMLIMWLLEMFLLRSAIKRDLTGLESSLKKRNADLEAAQSELAVTNAALQHNKNELQNAVNSRTAAENQVADLKPQLARTATELDATRQARQQLETTLSARTVEANDLRAKLTTLTNTSNAQRTQLESLGKERDQLQRVLMSTQSELETSRSHHRDAAGELAKLTATAAVTAATLKALEGSKRELTARSETLNAELTRARVNAEQLSASLAETNAARANLETMLQESWCRFGELEGAHHVLEGLTANLAHQNHELDHNVKKLTAGALAASALIKHLETEQAALTGQHFALQSKFDTLLKTKALDDVKLAEFERQLAQVNTALGITVHDKQTYRQTLHARVQELGNAQRDLTRVNKENSDLLQDVAKFSSRAAAAAALVRELESSRRAPAEQLGIKVDAPELQQGPSHRPSGAFVQTAAGKQTDYPSPVAATIPVSDNGNSRAARPGTAQPIAAPGLNGEHAQPDRVALESRCPQDLSRVRGIGEEFEHRLYNAGIGTYWDLSQLSDTELAETLRLNETQRAAVNLAAIRGDALQLARETNSQNRTWKGSVPEDLAMLIGVGHTYERRLYEAGICTFEALAHAQVNRVAGACHAPHLHTSDYQSWINQARVLIEARRRGI